MNDEEIQVVKQSCEMAISMFISGIVADFKSKTNREISSIMIPMIDVTSMDSLPKTQYIPGQCNIVLVEEQKSLSRSSNDMTYWICCGGIHLEVDESCPVCGDKYD